MVDYDILFLSKLIPENMEIDVSKKSKNNMEDAANALQWHLIRGIDGHNVRPVQLFNLLPIGSYPKYYSDCFIKTTHFSHIVGADDRNIGFCNLTYVKQVLRKNCILKSIQDWARKEIGKPKVIISYTPDIAFLTAVKHAKKINPEILSCVIIADLPRFIDLSSKSGGLLRLYKKFNANRIESSLNLFDGYVLLTKHMRDYLGLKKPSVVIEGIATEVFKNNRIKGTENNIKTIFYGGTLHKKYGILNLIEAFKGIKDENYRLNLCGIGDSVNEILEVIKGDKRIRYFGQLPRKKVLSLMKESTVLVNPRQNNEEFTKYSFPSKNLECLSSGVPLVAYKLDGIPDEYDNYIYYVTGSEPEDLKAKILEVCEKGNDVLVEHGRVSKDFVLRNKNSEVQTSKIVKLINEMERFME